MLVLSRRSQESIVIGGNIRVTIIKTSAGVVRLGIDAPIDVAVHREEIQQQIDEERVDGRESQERRRPGPDESYRSPHPGMQG